MITRFGWIVRGLVLLSSITLYLLMGPPASAQKKNQLEELFIWKMSDELKLSASEEKNFAKILKDLGEQKVLLTRNMQKSLEEMGKLSKPKEISAELAQYRKYSRQLAQLNDLELEKMGVLLGPVRTVKYLQFKQDLTIKLKSMLANPETEKIKKSLPQPQLIEEK